MTTPNDDPLGYKVYANTLWKRIQAALNKDVTSTDGLGGDPLVVGIFGEWGAGKSYLLDLVQKQAKAHMKVQQKDRQADSGFSLTVPVFFQPWKYEHEEHLHVPLMLHIIAAFKDAIKAEPSFTDALAELANTSESKIGKLTSAAQRVANGLKNAYPYLQMLVAGVSTATVGVPVTLPAKVEEWLESAADASEEASDALKQGAKNKASDKAAHQEKAFRFSADGTYFYRMNELFKKLTRPANDEWLKTELDSDAFTKNTRINFVIFVDDLDRCLPEKAVQTLELIKTVFNVESFAFVLALDDEVIERGIGHRYKEYKLQDKKPEMPITGFEYLEKIVHLPFRLPSWTAVQAMNFVRAYEAKIQPDAKLRWFNAPLPKSAQKFNDEEGDSAGKPFRQSEEAPIDLLPLALSAFSAYVPRKLIRMVELMQQTGAVALGNGHPIPRSLPRSLSSTQASGTTALDARVVLALALIQLFQPEMFRLMRRNYLSFAQLLEAFTGGEIPSSNASDLDLWAWARFKQELPLSASNEQVQSTVVEALDPYAATVQIIAKRFNSATDAAARYYAQQVRLPLVAQLVEHRAVQRHVFDVLKLMQELAAMGVSSGLRMRDYFSFLSPDAMPQDADNKPVLARVPVGNLDVLLDGLFTDSLSARANLASEIGAGCVIGEGGSKRLLAQIRQRIDARKIEADKRLLRMQLLHGLHYLSPHIHPDEQADYWTLVKDCGVVLPDPEKPIQPNASVEDTKQISLYLDVRSMLGQDRRFNQHSQKAPYLNLITRLKEDDAEEDLMRNFVRFEGGSFTPGHPDEPNNDSRQQPSVNLQPFYMARSHTTVDQYKLFCEDETAYQNKDYWDDQGWEWMQGSDLFKRELPDEKYWRDWLEQRKGADRCVPWNWSEQRRIGARAVSGISWFEARAYARWLDGQLKAKLLIDNRQYRVCLPTELAWEYAARGLTQDGRQWPWGNDKNSAKLRANSGQTIGRHPNVPGCFAPNDAGLWDMAGNLWQWQDGLYQAVDKAAKNAKVLAVHESTVVPKSYMHTLTSDFKTSDALALRGGSWVLVPLNARVSFRYGNHPDYWNDDVGVRVMLSLV